MLWLVSFLYEQPHFYQVWWKVLFKIKSWMNFIHKPFCIFQVFNIFSILRHPINPPSFSLPPSSLPEKFFVVPSLKRNEIQKISSVYLITKLLAFTTAEKCWYQINCKWAHRRSKKNKLLSKALLKLFTMFKHYLEILFVYDGALLRKWNVCE